MKKYVRALGAALLLLFTAEIADLAWLNVVRATITTTSSSVTAGGNGATTSFAFNFVAGCTSYGTNVACSNIQVTYTDATGVSTVLSSSVYHLNLTAPGVGQVWGIGGTVTYPLSGSPIALGTTLTIARTVPLEQLVTSNNGQLFPVAVERALDLLDMQVQQVSALFSRALVQPITDSQSLAPLPAAAQRANQALCFDATGYTPIGCSVPSSGVISSAMQPVVSAASLAAGRTAFGLGGAATENIGSYGLNDYGDGFLQQRFTQVSDAINQTVSGSYQLSQRNCSGPVSYFLNRANTLGSGFGFWVHAVSGTCTLTPDSHDNFLGLSSGASTVLTAGQSAFVSTDGNATGTWYLTQFAWDSQAVLQAETGFSIPRCGFTNLKIVNDSGTPNTLIDITSGQTTLTAATTSITRASSNVTVDITSGHSSSTAGGMDGESPGTSAWVYLFVIDNGTLTKGLGSAASGNGLTPTLPSGYGFSCYAGAMRVDGSGNLLRIQTNGNTAQYLVPGTSPPTIASGSTSGVWTAESISAVVPPTAFSINVTLRLSYGDTGGIAATAPNISYGAISGSDFTAPYPPLAWAASTGSSAQGKTFYSSIFMNLQSSTIGYVSNSSSANLLCDGWKDGNVASQ